MEQRYLGLLALALVGCGPSYSGEGVKTPEQQLAEQERLGDEQLKKQRDSRDYADTTGPTEDEKLHEWDAKQAELELKRAVRSAETCPESVVEQEKDAKGKAKAKPKQGKAHVSLLFANDGHVKSTTASPPYDENAVGKCVQRAMNAIVVPAYKGGEHTEEWEIDLSGGKKSGPVGGDKADKPAADDK